MFLRLERYYKIYKFLYTKNQICFVNAKHLVKYQYCFNRYINFLSYLVLAITFSMKNCNKPHLIQVWKIPLLRDLFPRIFLQTAIITSLHTFLSSAGTS